MNTLNACRVLVIVGLVVPSPVVLAQPLEVADVETTRVAVEAEVERLVAELAVRDPELAQEIERQSELCIRDFSDGRLDHEGFTRDIETYRDVQREVTGEMKTEFDRAYQEALARGDTAGAEQMRTAFEAFEKGEAFVPTPETMERMHQEMERYMSEHPEMREYAMAEWDRYGQEMREYGAGPGEFERMHQEMERGFEMAREWEAHAAEFERYHEMPERNYENVQDQLKDFHLQMQGEGVQHVDLGGGNWDGNADGVADHTHPAGTGPHF